MATKTLDQHIELSPGIAGGKPRVAGHRITVHDIVIWHERLGKSADEIASDYALTLADVHAALAYYFDHRSDIDRDIADGQAFVEVLERHRWKMAPADHPRSAPGATRRGGPSPHSRAGTPAAPRPPSPAPTSRPGASDCPNRCRP